VLQKISGPHDVLQLFSLLGLGGHSKEAGDEGDLSLMSPLPSPLTCPLRIMFMLVAYSAPQVSPICHLFAEMKR